MAHDIGFINHENQDECYFIFGYFQGIFYREFKAEHLNNGVSGANRGVLRDRKTVFDTLEKISQSPEILNYPDKKRFPDFHEKIKKSEAKNFIVHFS